MARKSRKGQIAAVNTGEDKAYRNTERKYSVGIYVRKSCAEENNSDSINTQISMVENFVAKNDNFRIYDIYADNGETGTKFDRPEFNRLMEDIRTGSVDCVVVKDLSRFGRNYMEAGALLETIFPYMNVRFIAVNEHYDSLSETAQDNSLTISVENLLNDLYAKDISKKINSAYLENFKQGNYMGAYAPYGYLRSPDNCHRFIIDSETAPTVKKIFEMKANGETYQGIANYLNKEGIESPSNYKYRIGILRDKRFAAEKPWLAGVVKSMLSNQCYIGNIVQGKKRCRNSTNNKMVAMAENDWFISENMHKPIIDRDLWDKVQKSINETEKIYKDRQGKYKDRFQPENLLFKKIICSECGKFLRRGHQCPKDYIIYSYYCANVNKDGSKCKCRYHNEQKLFQIIFEAIRQQIKLALDTKKVLIEFEKMPAFNAEAERLGKELTASESKLKSCTSKKTMLYGSYSDGTITLNDYNSMRSSYDKEIQELNERIESLTLELYKQKNLKSTKNKWIVEFEKFNRQRKLTKDMVTALIDRIYVHGQYELEIVFIFRDEYLYLMREIEKMKENAV